MLAAEQQYHNIVKSKVETVFKDTGLTWMFTHLNNVGPCMRISGLKTHNKNGELIDVVLYVQGNIDLNREEFVMPNHQVLVSPKIRKSDGTISNFNSHQWPYPIPEELSGKELSYCSIKPDPYINRKTLSEMLSIWQTSLLGER